MELAGPLKTFLPYFILRAGAPEPDQEKKASILSVKKENL